MISENIKFRADKDSAIYKAIQNNITESIFIVLSTLLHMSYIVRADIETEVKASISTPVLPMSETSALISTQF